MRPFQRITRSPEETRALAARLGDRLAPGDVVALNGELGSGKTEFVHGLAQGLGVPPHLVASPSFTLVHEYPGRVLLVHLDLYRLEDLPASLLPDLEEYLSGPQVVVAEWARRLAPLAPRRLPGSGPGDPGGKRAAAHLHRPRAAELGVGAGVGEERLIPDSADKTMNCRGAPGVRP